MTDDWERVDCDSFLRELVEGFSKTYSLGAVNLVVESESVFFDVEKSINCCLKITELVTNSTKHAFSKGSTGTERVGLKLRPDGLVVLEIADDRVGFPADLDFRQTESMGMQIAVSLVKNLEGQIELIREGGTSFQIAFAQQSS